MIEKTCWKCKKTKEQIKKGFSAYPKRWICHSCYHNMMSEIQKLKAKIKHLEKKYNGKNSNSKIFSEFKRNNSIIITSLNKMQEEAKKLKNILKKDD